METIKELEIMLEKLSNMYVNAGDSSDVYELDMLDNIIYTIEKQIKRYNTRHNKKYRLIDIIRHYFYLDR